MATIIEIYDVNGNLISTTENTGGGGGDGTGDVVGPSSATDNAIARFDTTTGKLIQNSSATIDDSGNVTGTSFIGPLTGAVTGNVTGNLTGNVTGNVSGTALSTTGVAAVAKGGTNSSTSLNNNRVMQSSGGAIVEASAITGSRALVSDPNGIPTHATTTSTEIGYVNGVTSAIQTQINTKSPLISPSFTTPTLGVASATSIALAGDPSTALQAATKQYVDNVAAGLDPKPSVICATTANITLSGEQTLDGILTSASRVLVKNQTAPAENGIYVSAAGSWTRATDMDAWIEVPGAFCFVEQGTLYSDCGFVCTSNAGGTIGSTSIAFTQFSGAGSVTAGTGIAVTGTQVAIDSTVATLTGAQTLTNKILTAPTMTAPVLGTIASGVATNLTGTAASLTAGNVTTNANLTGDVTSVGNASTIATNAVTNAKAAQMAAHTYKGNNTGSTANSIDVTSTQLTADLNAMVGDSGSGGTKGLVPAPASGDAAAGKYLKADGTFAVPPGSGGSAASPSASGTVTSYIPVIRSGVTTVTNAAATATETDGFETYLMSTGNTNRTWTSPANTVSAGRTFRIIKTDTGTGKVTITAGSGLTLQDPNNGSTLYAQNAATLIYCDGTNLFVIHSSINVGSTTTTWTLSGGSGATTSGSTTVKYVRQNDYLDLKIVAGVTWTSGVANTTFENNTAVASWARCDSGVLTAATTPMTLGSATENVFIQTDGTTGKFIFTRSPDSTAFPTSASIGWAFYDTNVRLKLSV